jgi:DNA-binding response OmpR family regulator
VGEEPPPQSSLAPGAGGAYSDQPEARCVKSEPGARVLIVEDEDRIREVLSAYLRREGYLVTLAADGRAGIEAARRERPDLVILDLMLPRLDGWDVCRALRAESRVPILIVTARDAEDDRLRGLGLGADDYVVKPFSPREVVARVAAILRRTAAPAAPEPRLLRHGPLALDTAARTVHLNGAEVPLTASEFTLLAALMAHAGRALGRAELVARLYPSGDDVVAKVVDVHIGELRRKLESDRAAPRFIRTVRGVGYLFPSPVEAR